MEEFKLFDAEYKFLDIIWGLEPINSTELTKVCRDKLGWKKPTTYTMLRKLSERGLLKNENATVTTIVKREQVQKYESEVLLEKSFDNSLPAFLATFLKDRKLSRQEAEEMKKMIEEATK
ncbi:MULTISPECIES: BlaI/MecI/CopY family transcriptional regulator [Desulfitobacterium]|uniref:Putative transcriptional regulator n=1 Tax=Desulfitobacterium dehalogenans (strain ATCC 51507 / DSM 9161 / JW/IU-DC1) TaxID=756499 RepID=I4A8H0_DESDJ|nr:MULTISPECIES: BlaI/MecI/CopY family transcriptional regulator [Desulfitobacterium]AFM00255.1 putative transcriptional regulator [Desulfitobacterium dehalogenans ATCC 51507]